MILIQKIPPRRDLYEQNWPQKIVGVLKLDDLEDTHQDIATILMGVLNLGTAAARSQGTLAKAQAKFDAVP